MQDHQNKNKTKNRKEREKTKGSIQKRVGVHVCQNYDNNTLSTKKKEKNPCAESIDSMDNTRMYNFPSTLHKLLCDTAHHISSAGVPDPILPVSIVKRRKVQSAPQSLQGVKKPNVNAGILACAIYARIREVNMAILRKGCYPRDSLEFVPRRRRSLGVGGRRRIMSLSIVTIHIHIHPKGLSVVLPSPFRAYGPTQAYMLM